MKKDKTKEEFVSIFEIEGKASLFAADTILYEQNI